jgi:hypothetical protein
MKRLFLLFFLFVSLSALYIQFVSCKEGARSGWSSKIKKMAIDVKKNFQMGNKTNKRLAKK